MGDSSQKGQQSLTLEENIRPKTTKKIETGIYRHIFMQHSTNRTTDVNIYTAKSEHKIIVPLFFRTASTAGYQLLTPSHETFLRFV
jgi:hypothetical protein